MVAKIAHITVKLSTNIFMFEPIIMLQIWDDPVYHRFIA